MKFEEYKDNKIVKSLLDLGFSQDYIEKCVESGEIKLEKSSCMKKSDSDSDTEEEDVEKKEVKEKVEEEKSEKEKKDKKHCKDCEEEDDKLAKSFEMFNATVNALNKSIGELNDKIDRLNNNQTPNFKSQGLDNVRAIEKSFTKDENDKYEVNVINQRAVASKLISQAIESAPEEIAKSLEDDALAYLTNPEANTVGENLARYMYKKGIKFVK